MNALLDAILSGLSTAGYVLDTPGALLRGALSGRPGERASGRDMLESWGVLGENQDGIDAGDVLGFGADVLVDPLNLLGAGMVKRGLGLADDVAKSNKLREAMLAKGAMPEEVAKMTQAADASGPMMLLRGARNDAAPLPFSQWTRDVDYANRASGADELEDAWNAMTQKQASIDMAKARLDDLKAGEWDRNVERMMRPEPEPVWRDSYGDTANTWDEASGIVDDISADMQDANQAFLTQRIPEMEMEMELTRQLFGDLSPRVDRGYLDIRNPYRGSLSQRYYYDPAVAKEMMAEGYDGAVSGTGAFVPFRKEQIYYPAVAPAARRAPSMNPLLAAIASQNALQAGSGY